MSDLKQASAYLVLLIDDRNTENEQFSCKTESQDLTSVHVGESQSLRTQVAHTFFLTKFRET